MYLSHKHAEAPERPITFRAAEDLGAFGLAQLWPTAGSSGLLHGRTVCVRSAEPGESYRDVI